MIPYADQKCLMGLNQCTILFSGTITETARSGDKTNITNSINNQNTIFRFYMFLLLKSGKRKLIWVCDTAVFEEFPIICIFLWSQDTVLTNLLRTLNNGSWICRFSCSLKNLQHEKTDNPLHLSFSFRFYHTSSILSPHVIRVLTRPNLPLAFHKLALLFLPSFLHDHTILCLPMFSSAQYYVWFFHFVFVKVVQIKNYVRGSIAHRGPRPLSSTRFTSNCLQT